MELILQQQLPHQQKPIDAISKVFTDVNIRAPHIFYENPQIDLRDGRLKTNIAEIQKEISPEYRRNSKIDDCLQLDIKMETGTGKTYVYTKAMYELHKQYGFNKFVIVVPSLAIKAGTEQFLQDDYARRHFDDACGYDSTVELEVVDASKKGKKGRSFFPSVVSDFVKGSCQNTKKIYVLLLNMQMLTSAKVLTRADYDYGVEGFYRPMNAIRATKPIVIMDEPHRFSRSQSAFKAIMNELKPQCLIRFGATFPEITTGRGKNKITGKDYQNLLYDLNACESFNQNLIKGVAKEHFEPLSHRAEKVKILSMVRGDSVKLQLKQEGHTNRVFTLGKDDSLSMVSSAFEGVTVLNIGSSTVEFSNGIEKTTGEELDVDVYMSSYQEQMMHLALQRHFETEKENFCNRNFRIKTLALFFIDDIGSYRPAEDGRKPYLLTTFERLLKEEIQKVMATLGDQEETYKNYLAASLNDISACHAGYFSQDNNDSDENVAREIDVILHGKKELLAFNKPDGSYNTLRFLFSKWTLKEGWDNPNVFTICKLRSSGSEISKLQEVGRGLRLPVDEHGNRVSTENFMLNYIVDFTEADFAKKLTDQINGELPAAIKINNETLRRIADKLHIPDTTLLANLLIKGYVDAECNIISSKREEFFLEYPGFAAGVNSGKITNRNTSVSKPIKIREGVYKELQQLWEKINQRYLLTYERELDQELNKAVTEILKSGSIFTDVTMTSDRTLVAGGEEGRMHTQYETGVAYVINNPIPYSDFLKKIMNATNIPITILHEGICKYVHDYGTIDKKYFNRNSVAMFCQAFQEWRGGNLQGRFHYSKCDMKRVGTALTDNNGKVRKEIAQGRIGTKIEPGTPSNKYLYDVYAYDSPLEKSNLTSDIEAVVVYGKIPRSSIAIPTIVGGTYSPDFMYVVKKANGEQELNIIVETKDVENQAELRSTEKMKIDCAKVFFDTLSAEGYKVHFKTQLNNKKMLQIIQETMRDSIAE